MSTTLIHNVTLACLTDATDYGLVEDGAVVIRNDRIQWAGKCTDLPERFRSPEIKIDGDGGLLTPGLIDCHTHLVYAGNRAGEFEQRLLGTSYADIAQQGGGIMATVNATRDASEAQLVAASAERLAALVDEGVTTVEIKSGYGLETDTELRMLRAAGQLAEKFDLGLQRTLLAAHALPPEYSGRADDYIDLVCEEIIPAAVAEQVVDAVDAFCEQIAFTPEQVERVFRTAADNHLPVKCHAEQLSDSGGTALSARYNALSADHLEYLNPGDIAAMATANMTAVLLPGAFYILKETQLPPIRGLREQGVAMALATDANPGSSPIFSPLLIMNMACTLFGFTPLEALAGFTIQAARALGLDAQTGSIEIGKQADLTLWGCQHPAELSYHIGLNPCRGSMRRGNWYPRR